MMRFPGAIGLVEPGIRKQAGSSVTDAPVMLMVPPHVGFEAELTGFV